MNTKVAAPVSRAGTTRPVAHPSAPPSSFPAASPTSTRGSPSPRDAATSFAELTFEHTARLPAPRPGECPLGVVSCRRQGGARALRPLARGRVAHEYGVHISVAISTPQRVVMCRCYWRPLVSRRGHAGHRHVWRDARDAALALRAASIFVHELVAAGGRRGAVHGVRSDRDVPRAPGSSPRRRDPGGGAWGADPRWWRRHASRARPGWDRHSDDPGNWRHPDPPQHLRRGLLHSAWGPTGPSLPGTRGPHLDQHRGDVDLAASPVYAAWRPWRSPRRILAGRRWSALPCRHELGDLLPGMVPRAR